jgi:16S rRNA processing protein RimM
MSERVIVGIVRRTRGVHGELVVESQTDLPDRFGELKQVYLVTPEGELPVSITHTRYQSGTEVWLQLAEVTDRDEAKELRGATLEIALEERPELPDGIYYYDQLEGLEVRDTTDQRLGTITRVYPRGGQDLYEVETDSGLAYIPATDAIIKQVDLEARVMIVDPPPGLLVLDDAY